MPVVVYGFEVSPPVRSVLLTAKAIGLDVQLKVVDTRGKVENMTEEYLKINPAHTVPTLDDNGFLLIESRAIMAYLVQQYGKTDKLYPKDLKKRAIVDSMLFYDASGLFPKIIDCLRPQLFQGKPPTPESEAAMKHKFGIINTMLGRHPYFAGDHLTIADLSLINSLTIPEIAIPNVFDAYPNIKKWMAKVKAELPFYDEVTKNGLDGIRAMIANAKK